MPLDKRQAPSGLCDPILLVWDGSLPGGARCKCAEYASMPLQLDAPGRAVDVIDLGNAFF